MALRVAVLPGDGVGPEVTEAALRVLRAALEGEATLEVQTWPVGWAAVQEEGVPLPPATLDACREADAVFLGAVGHPDADGEPRPRRPETGLLALRRELGCWANLRPVRVPEALVPSSALRPERVRGTDLLVLRELAGGLYYGEPRGEGDGWAWNTLTYSEDEVRRIARMAMDLARGRRGRVTSVDKANVLEVSGLWRRVVDEVAREHGQQDGKRVEVDHMLVDRAAMELCLNPTRFDVLLTENLFGDILSDQGAGLTGSLGVLASASLGGRTDLYEPVHGSAPDIAGQGRVNPMGAIGSVAMMLRHTFRMDEAASRVEAAVDAALADGVRTVDLAAAEGTGAPPVDTATFTDAVVARLPARSHAGRAAGTATGATE